MLVEMKDKMAKLWTVKQIKENTDAAISSMQESITNVKKTAEDAKKVSADNASDILGLTGNVNSLDEEITACIKIKNGSNIVNGKNEMCAAVETFFRLATVGDSFEGKYVNDSNTFGASFRGVKIADNAGTVLLHFYELGGQGGIIYMTRDTSVSPSSLPTEYANAWKDRLKLLELVVAGV